MARLFADLHLHPSLYAFNRMRNTPEESNPERFHAWSSPPSNLQHMAKGARASEYSQCDFAKMSAGRLRLAFTSITPIETPFFAGFETAGKGTWTQAREVLKLATGITPLVSLVRLARGGSREALRSLTGVIRNDGPLRRLLVSRIMHYPAERIAYMLSPRYDYWEALRREYDFLCSRDGERTRSTLETPQGNRPHAGTYHVIRDAEQLESVVTGDGDAIACVLTIEGGHVFSIGPDQERVADDLLFDRIEQLKRWPHPIHSITLAHHFDNGICGHAHSLPDAAGLVIDQRRRLHEDFEAEGDLGLRAVRALLDLDEDLERQGGRRILIDVKHMSPRARKTYYASIVEPVNARQSEAHARIPVIMSHAGYSGVPTLDEQIANAHLETDHWHRGPYNAWGINASDDDVRAVFRSGGLIGLCFDQRIAGVMPGQKLTPEQLPYILLNQLLGMVDVIMLDDAIPDDEKIRAWDCFGIGSDFDGLIDPISAYPTALSLDAFAEDLERLLHERRHTRMIAEVGVDAIVEKIAWRNAYEVARATLEP